MESFWKTVGFLIALVVVGAFAAGGLYAIHYMWTLFTALDSWVALIFATASTVAVVCALIIAAAIRSAGSGQVVQVAARNRAAVYRRFTGLWSEMLYRDPMAGKPIEKEFEQQLQDLAIALAMYGSAAVVRAHAALRALCRDNESSYSAAREEFLKGLVAVRRDLGRGDWDVQRRELDILLSRDGAALARSGLAQADRGSAASQAT